MKTLNKLFVLAALMVISSTSVYAQLRVSNFISFSNVANSSAFLDASSSNAWNTTNNLGKGLIFPRVDLTTFTFSPTAGFTMHNKPTRFDGMIVYNVAVGGVALEGATEGELTRGFWFYDNPGTNPGLRNGTWRPLGGGPSTAGWLVGGNEKNTAVTQYLGIHEDSDNAPSIIVFAGVGNERRAIMHIGRPAPASGTSALEVDLED